MYLYSVHRLLVKIYIHLFKGVLCVSLPMVLWINLSSFKLRRATAIMFTQMLSVRISKCPEIQ